MTIRIFYSWQTDISDKLNRNFIEDALEKAIKKLGKDIEIQEALRNEPIEIDKDTKGVPGTPPIVEVIFNKISSCGVFVPDLTFVGKSKDGRLLPNPNVLIEYGWALKELSHSRIVSVMNTAFGEPTAVNMPFDLRHLRNPLTYHLDENATEEERTKIKATLVNDLYSALETILKSGILTQTDVGSNEPWPLGSLDSSVKKYKLSEEAKILLLKASSSSDDGTIVRIAGVAIEAGGESFGEGGGRESARWEQALNELLEKGLVVARGYKGEIFELTHEGWMLADELKEEK